MLITCLTVFLASLLGLALNEKQLQVAATYYAQSVLFFQEGRSVRTLDGGGPIPTAEQQERHYLVSSEITGAAHERAMFPSKAEDLVLNNLRQLWDGGLDPASSNEDKIESLATAPPRYFPEDRPSNLRITRSWETASLGIKPFR